MFLTKCVYCDDSYDAENSNTALNRFLFCCKGCEDAENYFSSINQNEKDD